MLNRSDLRGHIPSPAQLRASLPRAEVDVDAVLHQVRPMVDTVRERGVEAVLEFAVRFDRVRPASVRVPAAELRRALAALDPAVRAALEESIARARLVHRDQRRTTVTTQVVPGGTVTERWVPVARVGLPARANGRVGGPGGQAQPRGITPLRLRPGSRSATPPRSLPRSARSSATPTLCRSPACPRSW